jgi:conjugal transfer/entry exclusion protein
MTAVSLINPYAPQPAVGAGADHNLTAAQAVAPAKTSRPGNNAGNASSQSGHGAGNGTGTGGAQLVGMIEKNRSNMAPQEASLKSVVEAQSATGITNAFFEQQVRQKLEATAAEADRIETEAEEARVAEAEAARPEFDPPNPLPTAPILERES